LGCPKAQIEAAVPIQGIIGDASATPSLPQDAEHLTIPPSTSSARPESARSHSLRRTASDDSMLYHTMSQTSFDNDSRFDHVREMTNVRMKAFRDSLPDRPTFKMPSLPTLPAMPSMPKVPKLPSPLRKSLPSSEASNTVGSSSQPDRQPSATDSRPSVPFPSTSPMGEPEMSSAQLDHVLETLTGDIVVLGGYRGSVLRDAAPPHHQVWAPVKIGLNMRKVDLEVGLEPEDEESMAQRIIPSGMLQSIGPIDISKRLFRKLRACENAKNRTLRIWDYGYDWRLGPGLLSRKLEEYLEKLPSNQPARQGLKPEGAWVIAHSRESKHPVHNPVSPHS